MNHNAPSGPAVIWRGLLMPVPVYASDGSTRGDPPDGAADITVPVVGEPQRAVGAGRDAVQRVFFWCCAEICEHTILGDSCHSAVALREPDGAIGAYRETTRAMIGERYVVICPLTLIRPIDDVLEIVYQRFPSGPSTIPKGPCPLPPEG